MKMPRFSLGWLFYARAGMLLLSALGCMTPAIAAPGVMLRDDLLRALPSAQAARLGSVKKGVNVDILGNRGGWTQVRAGRADGWVRLLSVRGGVARQADLQAGLDSARDAVTSPHDLGAVTATSGLRGLDLADLSAARYDAVQVEKLERNGVARTEAAEFAARGGLKVRSIGILPDPDVRADTPSGIELPGG